jgi:hypothetical protein
MKTIPSARSEILISLSPPKSNHVNSKPDAD